MVQVSPSCSAGDSGSGVEAQAALQLLQLLALEHMTRSEKSLEKLPQVPCSLLRPTLLRPTVINIQVGCLVAPA